jgi:hypothetical protein
LFLVALFLATPQPVLATTVFDDHFTGNSGGMPAGWSLLLGTGAVIEVGTTVTLSGAVGDIVAIASDATIDPSSGTVVIETEIAGIGGQGGSGLIAGPALPLKGILCVLQEGDGRIEVTAADAEGGEQSYIAGYVSGYAGGPISLTLEMGPTAFRISTDSPPFDSGSIPYTVVFPTFTRDDLGTAASVMLLDHADPESTIIDRILVDVGGATPVEGMTFGRIKALYGR